MLVLTVLLFAGRAQAQPSAPGVSVVAIPPFATPDSGSKANQSLALAWQATQMIVSDLRTTSELMPLPPNRKDFYSYPEVTAPTFSKWRSAGADQDPRRATARPDRNESGFPKHAEGASLTH